MNMEKRKKKVSWILCHDDHLAAILPSDEIMKGDLDVDSIIT